MEEIQMAMTQNFVRLATDDTESDYLEYKQLKDEKIIKADDDYIEYFDYTTIAWYHWNTVACRTKSIYDLYRVYEEWKLICESEDEVIELPEWCNHGNIIVKGYNRLENGNLVWLAESYKWYPLSRQESDSYKLSVVVPCYKAELFMSRTIDSILSSTLTDIEVIIVNDGSPEKDLEIAKRYAEMYGCVKVIDKPNTWLCDTRNHWMDIATGEYLAFCDADDIIHPYMYEILYNACKKENTDIAISSVMIREQPNKKERFLRLWKDVVYTFDEMMSQKQTKDNIYFVAVWNKIVKTEVAKKARFPLDYIWKHFVYEDIAYTGSLYSYIDRFAYCNDAIYTWEKRKRNTVWTVSTWHRWDDNDYIRKSFIFWASYPLYHKSWNHLERHDYIHFKRIMESYAKFKNETSLKIYWDQKLHELIDSQKLYENKLIMADPEFSKVVNRLR